MGTLNKQRYLSNKEKGIHYFDPFPVYLSELSDELQTWCGDMKKKLLPLAKDYHTLLRNRQPCTEEHKDGEPCVLGVLAEKLRDAVKAEPRDEGAVEEAKKTLASAVPEHPECEAKWWIPMQKLEWWNPFRCLKYEVKRVNINSALSANLKEILMNRTSWFEEEYILDVVEGDPLPVRSTDNTFHRDVLQKYGDIHLTIEFLSNPDTYF